MSILYVAFGVKDPVSLPVKLIKHITRGFRRANEKIYAKISFFHVYHKECHHYTKKSVVICLDGIKKKAKVARQNHQEQNNCFAERLQFINVNILRDMKETKLSL